MEPQRICHGSPRVDLGYVPRVSENHVNDFVFAEGEDVVEVLFPAGFVHERLVEGSVAF